MKIMEAIYPQISPAYSEEEIGKDTYWEKLCSAFDRRLFQGIAEGEGLAPISRFILSWQP